MKNADDRNEMLQVGTLHNRSAQKLRAAFLDAGIDDALCFGAGGCRFCRVCAKKAGLPCRSPQKAIKALEAYGIDAAKMAASAGMEYICERGSISYFGAVFFNA